MKKKHKKNYKYYVNCSVCGYGYSRKRIKVDKTKEYVTFSLNDVLEFCYGNDFKNDESFLKNAIDKSLINCYGKKVKIEYTAKVLVFECNKNCVTDFADDDSKEVIIINGLIG